MVGRVNGFGTLIVLVMKFLWVSLDSKSDLNRIYCDFWELFELIKVSRDCDGLGFCCGIEDC